MVVAKPKAEVGFKVEMLCHGRRGDKLLKVEVQASSFKGARDKVLEDPKAYAEKALGREIKPHVTYQVGKAYLAM